MKKLIFLSALTLVLSACDDKSQQVGVLEVALKALRGNDSKTFFSLLTGRASEKFGNTQGMQQLKARLDKESSLSAGKDTVVSSRHESDGSTVAMYAVPILNKDKEIMMAEVKCITTISSWESEDCYDPTPRHDNDDRNDRDDREPNPPRYTEPSEPREPNPPRYHEPEPREPRPREPRGMIETLASANNYSSSHTMGMICHPVVRTSRDTRCKVADLR